MAGGWWLWLGLAAAGCVTPAEAPPAPIAVSIAGGDQRPPRSLDERPRESSAPAGQALPPGEVQAEFRIDTGGDQMTAAGRQAGLGVTVRFGDRVLMQTFASCREAGHGSALGGGTETVLDVALCDDAMYWLATGDGTVAVLEIDANGVVLDQKVVIPLPEGITHARPVASAGDSQPR